MHETWWSILTDPDHIIAELIIGLVEEVGLFLLGYWWAKKRMWKKLHDKFDREHGLSHD